MRAFVYVLAFTCGILAGVLGTIAAMGWWL